MIDPAALGTLLIRQNGERANADRAHAEGATNVGSDATVIQGGTGLRTAAATRLRRLAGLLDHRPTVIETARGATGSHASRAMLGIVWPEG
jgi:hypothetical protein